MGGRVLYDCISTSRRLNDLWLLPSGELSQLLYYSTYIHTDNWGHLPFDLRWVRLKALPGYRNSDDRLFTAMCSLLWCGLWDHLYSVDDDHYVHVFNFESKSIEGIRKRRRGIWPDESGEVPVREKNQSITDSIQQQKQIIAKSKLIINHMEYLINEFRNFPERSGIFRSDRTGQDRIGQDSNIKITGTVDENSEMGSAYGGLNNYFDVISKRTGTRRSFLTKVYLFAEGDMIEFWKIMYRASKAKDPYAYIVKGIEEGYIKNPCQDEYDNPRKVDDWIRRIESGLQSESPQNGLISISELLKGAVV